MEAGLRMRRIWEVGRSWRLHRGLYEVAEVAFLRARSHGRPRVQDLSLPPALPPYPDRATPAATPASAKAESQNESRLRQGRVSE